MFIGLKGIRQRGIGYRDIGHSGYIGNRGIRGHKGQTNLPHKLGAQHIAQGEVKRAGHSK